MYLSGCSVFGNITSLNITLQCKTHSQLGVQTCSFSLNSNKMWWSLICWSAQGSVFTLQDCRRLTFDAEARTPKVMEWDCRAGEGGEVQNPLDLGAKILFFCGDGIRIIQRSLWVCSLVAAVSDGALQSERPFHLGHSESWGSSCILPRQDSLPLESSTSCSAAKEITICRCCSLISLGTQVVLWKLCTN